MRIKTAIYYSRIMAASSMGIERALPKKLDVKNATIKLTENCNSRCRTCDHWRRRREELITTRRAVDLLEQARQIGIETIRFAGGEPLLRKDFFQILESQPRRAFRKVVISTNGLLLKECHEAINNSIITDVAVSLDGLRDTNDRIRGVAGYFDSAVSGLEKIRGKTVTIACNLTNLVVPELEELIGFCKDKGYAFSINILDDNLPPYSGATVRKNINLSVSLNTFSPAQKIDRG